MGTFLANKVILSDIFLLYMEGVLLVQRLYTYEEIVKTLMLNNYKLMQINLTVCINYEKIVVHRDGGYCVNLFIAEQYKNNKNYGMKCINRIEGKITL